MRAASCTPMNGTSLGIALLGGGAQAAYPVGALARVAKRIPWAGFPLVIGVSAGAANVVAGLGTLGESVSRLLVGWQALDAAEIFDSFPGGREPSMFGVVREVLRRARESARSRAHRSLESRHA